LSALPSNPLVSVILPVFNGAEFVSYALESISLQTYENLEVIVVDDGSTDGTQAILQGWTRRDPRVRLIVQANAGVARARNRAIAESSGEFVAPIDADDMWGPDKIETQVRRMRLAGEGTGLVYAWWTWIDAAGTVLDRSPHWTIEGEALDKLIFINFTGNASVPLFRRSCLDEVGGYDESLAAAKAGGCEDWDVALRIAAKYEVALVPEILVGYRRHPGSMSSACDTMWRSQQRVMEGLRTLRPDLPPALFKASENQFSMYLAGLSYWAGNLREAWRWGLRAGVRLPILVSPYVLKMLLFPPRREADAQVMRPGVKLDAERIPEPLLPYDRVGNPRALVSRWLTWPARRASLRPAWLALKLRLVAERWMSRLPGRRRRIRVWSMACWHFPIYSQTFVYREILELMKGGFEVRFAYAALAPRSELPDDAAAVWAIRRRIPLFESTSWPDMFRCWHLWPQRFLALVKQISDVTGMSEKEVREHRHFRFACTFTLMAKAWGAEYIHTYFFYEQALYGLVASTLLGLPRGVSCYADHMLDDYELKLVALHMRTCDVVVATSARIKQELEAIAGSPVAEAIVKPNGIDASRYPVVARKPSGPDRVFKVVAVNRIHAKKGVRYLLEAAVMLRERGLRFVIEILGEPDTHDPETHVYAEELNRYHAANGLEETVLFRGRQTATEVRGHLAEADIFAAPFIELENGDKDGIPTALLEAMAAGCAAIVTDAGSIAEVVTDGIDGLMIPQRDASALADAMARVAGDDGFRARLSSAGRERVEQAFDVRVCEGAFHQRVRETIVGPDPFRSPEAGRSTPGALRIALVSYEYPPETGFGGIGTYTWYQARALSRLGHRVHVIAGSRDVQPWPLTMSERDGGWIFRIPSGGLWPPIAGILAWTKCYWTKQRMENAWGMYRAMRLLRTRYDYDIVEMPECGAEGALIAWLINIPSVVRFHGPSRLIMQFYDVPAADRVMCPWLEEIGIRRATDLNSCSRFLAAEVKERMGVKRPVEVIYNGIDLALFDAEPPADLAALYGVPEGQITILFAGRMERRKGIHLCGAIAEMVLSRHDVTILFAGDDLFGYLEETMLPALAEKELLGAVRRLGRLHFQELRAAAKAVDIYLLPSLWENCPYACMEAMAAGRAVVCSNQGGLPELIEHGVNGLLAETGSPESFATQLEALIEDAALRKSLGAAARRTIEARFTDEHIAVQTETFYRDCLARREANRAA
jgi:glycosyltransferase involved in cell wall biosynthesis